MSDRMPENNLHLPQDLMMEILPKLPVKSLVRFKCVSNSWKTLFTTPSFVSKQLSATSVQLKNSPLLILYAYDYYPTSHLLKLYSIGNPPSNLYKPLAERVSRIYGPCNGIFCLECQDFSWRWNLILWNPATREVKVHPPSRCPPSDEHSLVYGFGIDPKTDDYKIVKLLYSSKYLDSRQPTAAEVYNLTTDSWRIINDFVPASHIYDGELMSYANGVYYWLAEDGFDNIILSFDMSSETFEGIKAPLTEISSNDHDVYVVMNEYRGAESSWTKWSFTLHHERPGRSDNFLPRIYGCWKDDGIILSMEPSEELLYDEDGKMIGTFQPFQGFLASYKIHGSELRIA